jgi:hypothetical protein
MFDNNFGLSICQDLTSSSASSASATAVFSMEGKSPAEHVLISEDIIDTHRQIILKTF